MRQLWSGKFWLAIVSKICQLFTVYLPVLLIDLAFSGIITNTSFYTSYLGLSSTFLGVLKAVMTAFFVVLAIPFGRLSDRIERRYVLYAACLVLGACQYRATAMPKQPALDAHFPRHRHQYGTFLASPTRRGLLNAKVKDN